MTTYRCPNPKCLRHIERIKVIEIDKKTKKKWQIYQCPKCDYKSDLEPYTKDYKDFNA